MQYLVILTVVQPGYNQAEYATLSRLLQVGPDDTRAGIYEHMRKQLPERLRGANVLFFSAEPNRRATAS